MNDDKYPGRYLRDSERTAFGFGWEYKRRGGKIPPRVAREKWMDRRWREEFLEGFRSFICSDERVNEAMLREIAGK